jgi:triosephosphate isomerase
MKIIAGNWKMNGTPSENRQRLQEIKETADTSKNKVIVFPPFLSLPDAANILQNTKIAYGAQNCYPQPSGAYTGEISAAMLSSIGCSYCLVGHSERRQYFKEDSAFLKEKVVALMEKNMIPIYCVGESLVQREDGSFGEILEAQLSEVLKRMDDVDKEHLIIAYEPVWAIGTGKTATPADADDTMGLIREVLQKIGQPADIPLLYGGSAKPENAALLLEKNNIDGLLIGGASLKPADFAAMIKTAN